MSSQTTVVPHVKQNKRPSGPAAYAKAVRRYNINTPVFVGHKGAVYKRQTPLENAHAKVHHGFHRHRHGSDGSGPPEEGLSEVPAQDIQQDLEYVVPVTIGTPGVTLNLDFDTGSSDLWVWSTMVQANKKGHNLYDPSASSTAKHVSGATWEISYGDGSGASGEVHMDNVKIGSMTIANQAVESAKKLSQQFADSTDSDGLLGLAWPSINTVQPTPVATPVANIINQRLAPGIFSVALDKGDSNGFYSFGGIDADRAGVKEEDISYVEVDNSQGFWTVPSEATVINGKKIRQQGNTAILDTGTTVAMVSDEVVRALYAEIPGAKLDSTQGGWVYPADARVPKVSIALGGKLYELNAEDVAYGDTDNGMVFGGIQSRGNNPMDILGDVFLKAVYVIFDQEGSRVGIAHREGNVQPI